MEGFFVQGSDRNLYEVAFSNLGYRKMYNFLGKGLSDLFLCEIGDIQETQKPVVGWSARNEQDYPDIRRGLSIAFTHAYNGLDVSPETLNAISRAFRVWLNENYPL